MLRFFGLRHRRKDAHWNAEIKHRSLAWLAGNANLAAHELDILLADGQAQSSPGLRGSLAAQLHEGKEDALAILLAYAGPGILNLKSYLGFFGRIACWRAWHGASPRLNRCT